MSGWMNGSLIATISISGWPKAIRKNARPMRPNPLMATFSSSSFSFPHVLAIMLDEVPVDAKVLRQFGVEARDEDSTLPSHHGHPLVPRQDVHRRGRLA